MKKLGNFVLAIMLVFSIVGCSNTKLKDLKEDELLNYLKEEGYEVDHVLECVRILKDDDGFLFYVDPFEEDEIALVALQKKEKVWQVEFNETGDKYYSFYVTEDKKDKKNYKKQLDELKLSDKTLKEFAIWYLVKKEKFDLKETAQEYKEQEALEMAMYKKEENGQIMEEYVEYNKDTDRVLMETTTITVPCDASLVDQLDQKITAEFANYQGVEGVTFSTYHDGENYVVMFAVDYKIADIKELFAKDIIDGEPGIANFVSFQETEKALLAQGFVKQ